jgi:hypothetical protein
MVTEVHMIDVIKVDHKFLFNIVDGLTREVID